MTDTNADTVNKFVSALVGSERNYAYATGYLSSFMTDIINRYVPENKQTELRIEMLNEACDALLSQRRNTEK